MRRALVTTIRRFKRLVLATYVVVWVMALVATHVPGPELPSIHLSDWTLHSAGFFALGGLFWLALAAYGVRWTRRVPVVICVLVVYAALDETTQGWFSRNPDLGDWLADVLGAVLAVCLLETLRRLTTPHQQPASEAPPEDRYQQYPY